MASDFLNINQIVNGYEGTNSLKSSSMSLLWSSGTTTATTFVGAHMNFKKVTQPDTGISNIISFNTGAGRGDGGCTGCLGCPGDPPPMCDGGCGCSSIDNLLPPTGVLQHINSASGTTGTTILGSSSVQISSHSPLHYPYYVAVGASLGCTEDEDCPNGQQCVDGACIQEAGDYQEIKIGKLEETVGPSKSMGVIVAHKNSVSGTTGTTLISSTCMNAVATTLYPGGSMVTSAMLSSGGIEPCSSDEGGCDCYDCTASNGTCTGNCSGTENGPGYGAGLGLVTRYADTGTTGTSTTTITSDSLSMSTSLATNVKTATNIYPSYSQYSFSTTGMTGTSITSASKTYSRFQNNRVINWFGAYSVTNSGGDGGCDCADQYCGSGQLCAGSGNAGTDCHCMGDSEGGDGMYTVGSIDTVSGTTGTTMITSNSIEITTSDEDGTNLLTINSEGINITNETEGWTSANTPRTFKTTLNNLAVQDLGTPLELIPAPGDGKIINVESITLKIQGEGALITPYGGGVVLDFTFDGAHVPVFQSNELLLSSASRILAIPRAPEPSGPSERQIIANTKLSIATNSLSNPTGGEGLVGISINYTVEDDTWV